VFDTAVSTGQDDKAWRLAWVLAPMFEMVGRWAEALPMQEEAVAATRRCGDLAAEAQMHSVLAMGYVWQGRHDEADGEHTEAITLYDRCGDRTAQAYALINSAGSLQARGRFREARTRVESGLALLEEADDRIGQGMALCALTFLAGRLEDHTGSLGYAERALAGAEGMDDRTRAALLDNMAQAQSHLGRCAEALRNYREALRLIRLDGHAPYESEILTNLGDALRAEGDEPAAREAWEQALAIVDGMPDADPKPLRERLELRTASHSRVNS
jgi:tetratricopeptide (TPR) repeat protein